MTEHRIIFSAETAEALRRVAAIHTKAHRNFGFERLRDNGAGRRVLRKRVDVPDKQSDPSQWRPANDA